MRVQKILPLFLILVICSSMAGATDNTEKLITDLNASPALNQPARTALIGRGEAALPALLQEAGRYTFLTDDACMRSARSLRVIREMGSDQAVPVCIDILSFVPGDTDFQELLLNEALDYLYTHFEDMRARDAYYDLLKNRESKWFAPEKDFLPLFILNGIAPLYENNDLRGDDVLILLLKKLPYDGPKAPGDAGGRWNCTTWLGDDGYTREGCKTVVATYKTRTQRGPSCFYDPYYRERIMDAQCRYRITCLQLAKEYGTKKLIPAIEPLLKSWHRQERDLAMVTIEAINRKQEASTDKIDKIILVNGDVLSGTVQDTVFTILTAYGRVTLQHNAIKGILIDASRKKAIVELYSGDRLSGAIQEDEVKISLTVGGEATLKLSEVERITFGR